MYSILWGEVDPFIYNLNAFWRKTVLRILELYTIGKYSKCGLMMEFNHDEITKWEIIKMHLLEKCWNRQRGKNVISDTRLLMCAWYDGIFWCLLASYMCFVKQAVAAAACVSSEEMQEWKNSTFTRVLSVPARDHVYFFPKRSFVPMPALRL